MMKCLAGVDLGGTRIKAALATVEGEVIGEAVCPTEAHLGPEAVLTSIADLLERMASERNGQLSAVGMGVPGLVDLGAGITRFLPNLPTQWRDVPVVERLGGRLKCPVRLLNDARLATLGELRFGHGRGKADLTMAYFGLGTGVGGGVVVDGRLRLGPWGAAGELGHQTIRPDGRRCGCGNRGCLETLVSGPALAGEGMRLIHSGQAPQLDQLVRESGGEVTPRLMALAAERGEDSVVAVIHQAGEDLGIGIANLVTMLDPDLIVIGGGVALIGEVLFDVVRQVICQRVQMFPADRVQILPSLLEDKAGMMGGIALAGGDDLI